MEITFCQQRQGIETDRTAPSIVVSSMLSLTERFVSLELSAAQLGPASVMVQQSDGRRHLHVPRLTHAATRVQRFHHRKQLLVLLKMARHAANTKSDL
jgi:hypothetical protein